MSIVSDIVWSACQGLDQPVRGYTKFALLNEEKRDAVVTMLMMCDNVVDRTLIILDIVRNIWPPSPGFAPVVSSTSDKP